MRIWVVEVMKSSSAETCDYGRLYRETDCRNWACVATVVELAAWFDIW